MAVEEQFDRYLSILTDPSKISFVPSFNIKNLPVLRTGLKLQSRTRNSDISDAMRFRVYDPLWMLTRQWQLGEFRGNDAGTAMGVSGSVSVSTLSGEPMEPMVESIDAIITPMIRVQSALYYVSLCKKNKIVCNISSLMKRFPLDENDYCVCNLEDGDVQSKALESNSHLRKFYAAYRGKVFDGYKLYKEIVSEGRRPIQSPDAIIKNDYRTWFKNRYLPKGSGAASGWNKQSMDYSVGIEVDDKYLNARSYPGGRLSWYSFDQASGEKKSNQPRIESTDHTVTEYRSLPTLATYAGAPAKRLWQFEDHKVFMGNSTDMNAQGNVLMMQYATMYSNDWMLIPVEVHAGTKVSVNELKVVDTFGISSDIKRIRDRKREVTSDQEWQMFTITPEPDLGREPMEDLILPPSFQSTLESDPVEEVQFLRDEMANMIWGVEQLVPDGCGSTLNLKAHSTKLSDYVVERNESILKTGQLSVKKEEDDSVTVKTSHNADFKYLVMNSVPYNWIPFIPQRLKDDVNKRETVLRRGKMPAYVFDPEKRKGDYLPVRPVTSMIGMVKDSNGKAKEDPFYLNEEEILQTGVKLVRNYQRGRWLNGKVYTWQGYSRQLKEMQANSGLTFDKLIDPE